MKKLKVNAYKTFLEALKIGDPNDERILRHRIVNCRRIADELRRAAEFTKQNDPEKTTLIDNLEKKAKELEDLVDNYNMDNLDDDSMSDSQDLGDSGKAEGGENEDGAEGDEDEENDGDFDDEDFGDEGDESEDEDDESDEEDSEDEGDEEDEDEGDSKGQGKDSEDGENDGDSDEEDEKSDKKSGKSGKSNSDKDDKEFDYDLTTGESGGGDVQSASDSKGQQQGQGGNQADTNDGDRADNQDGDGEGDQGQDKDSKSSKGDGEGGDSGKEGDFDGSDDEGSEGKSSNSKDSKGKNSDSDSQGDNGEDGKPSADSKPSMGNGASNPKDPILNPFADNEDVPNLGSMMGGMMGGKEPRDPTIQEIIDMLSELSGDSRRGAIDGLKDVISSRNGTLNDSLQTPLTEAKTLRELETDEYNKLVNSAIDLLDRAKRGPKIIHDIKDKQKRVKNMDSVKADLEKEDNFNIKKDRETVKPTRKSTAGYGKYRPISNFRMNFYNAIKTQVDWVEQQYQSYDEINPEYEFELGSPILKADLVKEIPEEVKPSVEFYIDCSGSWGDNDVRLGRHMASAVKQFEDQGEITLDILYFANNVHSTFTPARAEGGTGAWTDILDNIKKNKTKNVVIMTDGDMDGSARWCGETVTVEGIVWWIWKGDYTAPECVKHLVGKKGNYEYSFLPQDYELAGDGDVEDDE